MTSTHPSSHQRQRLARLIQQCVSTNPFQRGRLAALAFNAASDPLIHLPLTTRDEIQQDQLDHPPYGSNLTYPLAHYTRLHQTSGSMGAPLRWLDTPDSWDWWKDCWDVVLDAACITAADVMLFPFSFGPFIGFWSAFEAALRRGNRCLPAGGMTSRARLRYLIENRATVVCCTPTYALHLAEVAREDGIDLSASSVRCIIVAGEPGGGIPQTRSRIECAWGASVFDHAGMTEMGAWGYQRVGEPGGLIINERDFIAEVIDPATGRPLPDGQVGELLLTNLGRVGSPLIRYRTGDLVRLERMQTAPDARLTRAAGGILGRVDDMLTVRGNNVYPAMLEALLHAVVGVAEFRIRVGRDAALTELCVDVEHAPEHDPATVKRAVERAVQDALNLRPVVAMQPRDSLPRSEFKARRFERT